MFESVHLAGQAEAQELCSAGPTPQAYHDVLIICMKDRKHGLGVNDEECRAGD